MVSIGRNVVYSPYQVYYTYKYDVLRLNLDHNYVTENTPPWTKADASVKLMKTISVGHGGIWAVNAKDDR